MDKDVAAQTDAGKRFQVLGVATGKTQSLKVDLRVDGTTSVVTSDEYFHCSTQCSLGLSDVGLEEGEY